MPQFLSEAQLDLPTYQGAKLYRFFDEERYAEDFMRGGIWISTLESCRNAEEPDRRDVGEGTLIYNTGTVTGDGDDPRLQAIARRADFYVHPGARGTTFINCESRVKVLDSYVLCLTERFEPDAMEGIGKFAVEITDPHVFFRRVTAELRQHRPIRNWTYRAVTYTSRTYRELETPPPADVSFIKPPDPYAKQQEVRGVWQTYTMRNCQPFLLRCPAVRPLLRRLI